MPANEGQFKFLWGIMNMLNEMGKSVAVLVLSYGVPPPLPPCSSLSFRSLCATHHRDCHTYPSADVAPAKQYPHQLRQSVELLRHVVDVLKKESSNVRIS
jgi:hypothetical protein